MPGRVATSALSGFAVHTDPPEAERRTPLSGDYWGVMENGIATLFHGTSRENADTISKDGFMPVDVDGHVHRISTRYGLDASQLVPALSFHATRRGDRRIYTTPSLMRAAKYANRAGELERLLLEQAYDLLFGEPESAVDAMRARWIRDQEPLHPAVVLLEVDLAELSGGERGDVHDHADRYDHSCPTAYATDVALSVTTANRSVVAVHDVDFCICTTRSAWNPGSCGGGYCWLCDQLRKAVGQPAPDDIREFDPFACPGHWFRGGGRPAVPASWLESGSLG